MFYEPTPRSARGYCCLPAPSTREGDASSTRKTTIRRRSERLQKMMGSTKTPSQRGGRGDPEAASSALMRRVMVVQFNRRSHPHRRVR
jgi:hypothetical protein